MEQHLCQLVLAKLLISYMYLLDPLVSKCVANKLKSTRFLYENLCYLGCFEYLVVEIFPDAVGLPT